MNGQTKNPEPRTQNKEPPNPEPPNKEPHFIILKSVFIIQYSEKILQSPFFPLFHPESFRGDSGMHKLLQGFSSGFKWQISFSRKIKRFHESPIKIFFFIWFRLVDTMKCLIFRKEISIYKKQASPRAYQSNQFNLCLKKSQSDFNIPLILKQ